MNFSQRHGYEKVPEPFQPGRLSDEVRVEIWNALLACGIDEAVSTHASYWTDYRDSPLDELPSWDRELRRSPVVTELKQRILQIDGWREVFDLVEFFLESWRDRGGIFSRLAAELNARLQRRLCPYRIVDCRVTPITDPQELAELDRAVADDTDRFQSATKHMQAALDLYADRDNPNHSGTISECVHAVEAMLKIVTDKPAGTAGRMLKSLGGKNPLYRPLTDALHDVWRWTCNEGGIRHGRREGDDFEPTADHAKLALVCASAIVNFLKTTVK